jgi:hypothetical protein
MAPGCYGERELTAVGLKREGTQGNLTGSKDRQRRGGYGPLTENGGSGQCALMARRLERLEVELEVGRVATRHGGGLNTFL